MKYKVGDKVIVREWDDMEKEFGLDSGGDIKAKCCFVESMREHCGKSVTITGFTPEGNYWVKESMFIFSEDTFEKKHHQKIVITTDGVETLARLYDGDKVVKKATAKCFPEDTFDFNVGAKLAFERLTKDDGKWRVVHRKPKVGDYIRLVRASFSFNEVGDILKVDDVSSSADSINVLGKNHPRDTDDQFHKWTYLYHEFEVIEPANGAVEEKKQEPPKYYYNGKVVCVKSAFTCFWTVGKVYEIKDGIVRADDGTRRDGITKENLKHIGDDRNEFIPLVE